jgi:prolipoprotein diacylglyceryltransferase
MAAVRPIRPEIAEPIGLHVQAMDNLRFIRNTMESAGAFTAVPGKGGILMGATALFAAFAAHLSANPRSWLQVWLGEAVLALAIGLGFSCRKARQNSTSLLSRPFRRFVLAVAPSVFVGALLTYVFYHQGISQLLPAMWLLLYGAGIASGGAFSVRVIPVMGMSFLALGSLAALSPANFADPLLAIGFGGFHILFGCVIARRYGG